MYRNLLSDLVKTWFKPTPTGWLCEFDVDNFLMNLILMDLMIPLPENSIKRIRVNLNRC